MKKIPLLFCLVLIFAGSVLAQTNQNAACPTIEISGGGLVPNGTPYSFTVSVKDYDLSKLSYKWTVSNGIILGGETTNVVIDVSQLSDGTNITATVEVKDLPEGCPNTASETTSVIICTIPPRLIDEFGVLPNGERRARIDAFFFALKNEPNAQGYIFIYGTKREIAAREASFRNLAAFRKYDTSRITFVRRGTNPNGAGVWSKLWLVPPGATPPTP